MPQWGAAELAWLRRPCFERKTDVRCHGLGALGAAAPPEHLLAGRSALAHAQTPRLTLEHSALRGATWLRPAEGDRRGSGALTDRPCSDLSRILADARAADACPRCRAQLLPLVLGRISRVCRGAGGQRRQTRGVHRARTEANAPRRPMPRKFFAPGSRGAGPSQAWEFVCPIDRAKPAL